MVRTIEEQMHSMYYYVTDPRMDGFSQFEQKKKLYKIKWLAEQLLDKCSDVKFIGEDEFIQENKVKQ